MATTHPHPSAADSRKPPPNARPRNFQSVPPVSPQHFSLSSSTHRPHRHPPPRQIHSMVTNPLPVFAGASSHISSPVLNTRPRRHIRSKSFPTLLPTLFTVPNCTLRSPMPLWFFFSDSKLVFQPLEDHLATDYLSLRL